MSNLNEDYNTLETTLRQLLQRQGRVLTAKPYPSNKNAYTFYTPKRFGWVHLKKRLDCLRVGVDEKFAKQAKVNHDGYPRANGEHNRPSYHWQIEE